MKRRHKIEFTIASIVILANSTFLACQFCFNRKFLYEQAHTLYEQGDKDKAIERYQEFLRRFPAGSYTDRVHYDLVRMSYGEKNYMEAVPRYEEFLSTFSRSECANKARAELAEMQQVLDDIEHHIAELGSPNVAHASHALREMGKPAVGPLIDALKGEHKGIRFQAAFVLAVIGDPRATRPLIAALNDENWAVQCCSADALGRMGDPRAIMPLIVALKYGNQLAARALEAITGEDFGQDSAKWEKWWEQNKKNPR